MHAEIIAVGSELLDEPRPDTNSPFLAQVLRSIGYRLLRQSILPDDLAILASALRDACSRSEVVICCGGLGSTADDCTVDAAAMALGSPPVPDFQAEKRLRQWLRLRRRRVTKLHLRQARRIASAEWLPNRLGTAWGQWCPTPRGCLVLLPGPPRELQPLVAESLLPRLAANLGHACATRVLSIAGMTETEVEAAAAPIYSRYANPRTTILALGEPHVELHFHAWAHAASSAQRRADRLARAIERRLGSAVFSRDRASLASVVGRLLRARDQTLAVAESCTGGLLGQRLTADAGASDYFLGGVIAYSNAAKQSLLGVPASTLDRWGAVSASTAIVMAAGVRLQFGASWGVSVTGIAGPGGGVPAKPVGTVFVGLAPPQGRARAVRLRLAGDRAQIRNHSAQTALNLLRLALLEIPKRR